VSSINDFFSSKAGKGKFEEWKSEHDLSESEAAAIISIVDPSLDEDLVDEDEEASADVIRGATALINLLDMFDEMDVGNVDLDGDEDSVAEDDEDEEEMEEVEGEEDMDVDDEEEEMEVEAKLRAEILSDLVKLADVFDRKGLHKEADAIDAILKMADSQPLEELVINSLPWGHVTINGEVPTENNGVTPLQTKRPAGTYKIKIASDRGKGAEVIEKDFVVRSGHKNKFIWDFDKNAEYDPSINSGRP
jgi:hypothetical protein